MRELPKLTDRRSLNGLSVGPACLGMIEDPDVVSAAFEAGINFFFLSADMHWPLYEPLRIGLTKLLVDNPAARAQIVIGAVSYATQPEFCWAPFEELLGATPALGHLDLLIAGGCYGYEIGRRLPVYAKHGRASFLGSSAIGASFHDRDAATSSVDAIDIGFVRYNPAHAGARHDVYAQPKRCLLYNFKSTMGHLDDADFETLGLSDDYWRAHHRLLPVRVHAARCRRRAVLVPDRRCDPRVRRRPREGTAPCRRRAVLDGSRGAEIREGETQRPCVIFSITSGVLKMMPSSVLRNVSNRSSDAVYARS